MNKKALIFVSILPLFALTACNNGQSSVTSGSSMPSVSSGSSDSSSNGSSSSTSNSESTSSSNSSNSSVSVPAYPSLREVMTNISALNNYTYSMYDEIFDMTTNMYYTENAYYVDYVNPSIDSAVDYGYAEDSKGQVFGFAIEDDEIVPGDYYRTATGNIVTGLWANAIISFADFNINVFADTPSADNHYQITDDSNKLLFAALAGYADVYVMPYVTVEVEVTGENSFISTVTFTPEGNDKYTGSCYGTLEAIGETVIPHIDEYIANGGSAATNDADALISVLQTLKDSNNYTLEVTTSSNHYIDTVTNDYYYSENVNTPSSSKGYLNVPDHAYNFTMSEGEVVLGNEITYTSSTSKSFWDNVSSVHNFNNINLSGISLEQTTEGLKLSNNTSFLSSLYNLVHSTSFFPTVNTNTDYVIFTEIADDSLSFTLHIESETDFDVKITKINSTENTVISDYIDTIKNHDASDISALVDMIKKIQAAATYQISLTNSFSSFAPALSSVGSLKISVSSDNYFVENLTDSTKSYGYKMNNGVLSKYTLNGEEEIFSETFEGDMANNDVFTTMSAIDADNLKGEATLQGDYIINDDAILSLFASLFTFPADTFITNVSQIALSITNENTLHVEGSTTFYGSFKADIVIL